MRVWADSEIVYIAIAIAIHVYMQQQKCLGMGSSQVL